MMEDGSRAHTSGEHGIPQVVALKVKHDGDGSSSGHKRSKSGVILGNLLRSSKDAVGKAPTAQEGKDEGHDQDAEGARGLSIATALRQSQGRQRKGSLRKTAIAKMRERSSSLRKGRTPIITASMSADLPDERTTSERFSYENAPLNSSSDSGWVPAIRLSPSTSTAIHDPVDDSELAAPRLLASPITSPVGPYASTTDEDDIMSFYRPSASSSDFSFNGPSQGPVTSLAHRRSNRSDRRTSVTAIPTPAEVDVDDEWDYSETEWWGWVVLIATWIVFVVGMGSCLGVWSWAWDVGETPYAPPDLEDDATLPITGYYPALIVCTAVMSWVWVVSSWVGLKYFKHSKVGVDG